MWNVPADLINFGKYSVLDRLGRGAFGIVYRCADPDLDRIVAVKVLLAAELAEPDLIERFSREARAAAKLSHPNIVAVFDAGVESGKPYLVMEYVSGRTLDAMMDYGQWDIKSVLQLIYHLADALSYSHDSGVLHRDVKPANVLVDERGRPKLADFGLARLADDARWLSATGDLLGTPRYMSPEQALLPSDEVDARADIYSLGAIFYELLAGHPLVNGPTALATLKELTDGTPIPLSDLRPDLPTEVIDVCEQMIAKEREKRFATASEVMTAIADILHPQAIESNVIVAFSRFPMTPSGVGARANSKLPTSDPIASGPKNSDSKDSPIGVRWRLPMSVWIAIGTAVVGIGFLVLNYPNTSRTIDPSQQGDSPLSIEKRTTELLTDLQRRSSGLLQTRDDAQYHAQLNEIREELNSSIRRNPNNEKLRRLRAIILARNGDYQMAIDDWESGTNSSLDIASRRMLLQTRAVWEMLYRS